MSSLFLLLAMFVQKNLCFAGNGSAEMIIQFQLIAIKSKDLLSLHNDNERNNVTNVLLFSEIMKSLTNSV